MKMDMTPLPGDPRSGEPIDIEEQEWEEATTPKVEVYGNPDDDEVIPHSPTAEMVLRLAQGELHEIYQTSCGNFGLAASWQGDRVAFHSCYVGDFAWALANVPDVYTMRGAFKLPEKFNVSGAFAIAPEVLIKYLTPDERHKWGTEADRYTVALWALLSNAKGLSGPVAEGGELYSADDGDYTLTREAFELHLRKAGWNDHTRTPTEILAVWIDRGWAERFEPGLILLKKQTLRTWALPQHHPAY